ncbi:MAG: manganese catalase family protein [Bacilli bacterium]|nr:manganese catalase family protein [Bacilli bacterium]
MWIYEKRLQFPINIKKTDPQLAKAILTQYGGPNGELAASLRYLSQRYTMPTSQAKAVLTDIGTEELAHLEMVATIIYQLTQDATGEDYMKSFAEALYSKWDKGIHPDDSGTIAFSATYINTMGRDYIADLYEDLAAEEKARATYEYLLDITKDPDVIAPLSFLRQREIVHFQRFGELLDKLQLEKNMKTVHPVNFPEEKAYF